MQMNSLFMSKAESCLRITQKPSLSLSCNCFVFLNGGVQRASGGAGSNIFERGALSCSGGRLVTVSLHQRCMS